MTDKPEPKLTWTRAMGVTFVKRTTDEVVAEIEIGDIHRQNFGLVHGGVHAGLIETVASLGALLVARERGQSSVVGIENHTSFIRAAKSGTLRITAIPITRGRRTQVWEGTVRDDQGQILAIGRVRLLCLDENLR
jgi:uncharacterized protein (TIGR00369 family)